MEQNQLAYRQFHSTETTLIIVRDDILKAIENKEVMCFILFDLSTAFVTIDHDILLKRLDNHFGIEDSVLAWIKSYLSDQNRE